MVSYRIFTVSYGILGGERLYKQHHPPGKPSFDKIEDPSVIGVSQQVFQGLA
jgi:hypothetical protein